MTRSPRLYLIILGCWSVLLVALLRASADQLDAAGRAGWPIVTLVVASTAFIA